MRSCLKLVTPHPSAFGCHLPLLGKAYLVRRRVYLAGSVAIAIISLTESRKERVLRNFASALLSLSFFNAGFAFVLKCRGERAFSCGRRGTAIAVDEELLKADYTSSVSLRLPPSPTGEGFLCAPKVRLLFLTSTDLIKDNKREAERLPTKDIS